MKLRAACAALLFVGGVASTAHAQSVTAESLIARNLAARGGEAALDGLKSIEFDGRMIANGDFELKYKEVRALLAGTRAASRTDLSVQGMDLVQGYDGDSGWKINPFAGRRDAERSSADDARGMADGSSITGALLGSRTDGSRVQYLGREDFDGTDAYKLKVTQKDGDEFTYWLDPDTFLEIKTAETRRIRGAQQTTNSELGDYEKVGGFYFPMSVETWTGDQSNQRNRLIIVSGSANPAVSPAMFAQPASPGAPAQAGGAPPDGSNKKQGGDLKAKEQPQTKDITDQPSSPPKGE